MKYIDRILARDRRSRSTRLQAWGLALVMLVLAACGGAGAGQEAEIIGIHLKASLTELQSGQVDEVEYLGRIVVRLADDQVVDANCPEEFLSEIEGLPGFNVVDEVSGGFVAEITVNLDEQQGVLVIENDAGEWEVTRVLD